MPIVNEASTPGTFRAPRKRQATTRLMARRYAKRRRIRLRNRRPRRLSPKAKAVVRRLKTLGFYRKIAKLHNSVDLGAIDPARHLAEYMEAVTRAASLLPVVEADDEAGVEDGETPTVRPFVELFFDRDPGYSTTPAGVAAIVLEGLLSDQPEFTKYLDTELVDDRVFYAYFDGGLSEDEIDRVREIAELVSEDFDVIVRSGQLAPDGTAQSEFTVLAFSARDTPYAGGAVDEALTERQFAAIHGTRPHGRAHEDPVDGTLWESTPSGWRVVRDATVDETGDPDPVAALTPEERRSLGKIRVGAWWKKLTYDEQVWLLRMQASSKYAMINDVRSMLSSAKRKFGDIANVSIRGYKGVKVGGSIYNYIVDRKEWVRIGGADKDAVAPVRETDDVTDLDAVVEAGAGKGAYARLVRKLQSRNVRDPKALAAWIGRKKLGTAEFQRRAEAGRRANEGEGETDKASVPRTEAVYVFPTREAARAAQYIVLDAVGEDDVSATAALDPNGTATLRLSGTDAAVGRAAGLIESNFRNARRKMGA